MIKTGRAINIQLGSGDSTLPNLLGGTFGAGGDVVTALGGGFGSRFFRNAKDTVLRAAVASSRGGGGGGGGGDGFDGCVQIDSFVLRRAADGVAEAIRAHQVTVGDWLLLDDGSWGQVSYSERKRARLLRVTTASLVSLVCSDTAPIPVRRGGYQVPERLIGHEVQAWLADVVDWDVVMDVQGLGVGDVQHITVGNRCFWAGELEGAYLLHHNAKSPGLPRKRGSDR
jgi:hypothetical protein